jgi:hypothetical protein
MRLVASMLADRNRIRMDFVMAVPHMLSADLLLHRRPNNIFAEIHQNSLNWRYARAYIVPVCR